ncbi:MAG: sodium:solute symporter family protein [Sedimentisphaerales bacterium]|jgi:Na+/proline symporter|nr:sodium:solute symporter family protein [Sedimentisphaerales bacterium]NLT76698.1 sodium:solute symporter family protein [Planctomycetota bacterium]
MIYLIAILIYLFALTGIGVHMSRRVKTQADFAVAGRTLSPWVMVCTMLAVWIGTGSIVGNAGQAFRDGMAALILPSGTFIGMILLSMIAHKARSIEVSSVPEIIGSRYGRTARLLAVVALIIAYMVIVSYQFNAGGMVLEVITGKKDPVALQTADELTPSQVRKGYLVFEPQTGWTGTTTVGFQVKADDGWSPQTETFTIDVVAGADSIEAQRQLAEEAAGNHIAVKMNSMAKIVIEGHDDDSPARLYRVVSLPDSGRLILSEPKLTARDATIIAAIFIITYTMLAGLLSLAFTDIVTGTIITVSLLIAFPVLLLKAGGFGGMAEAFAAMGDRPDHMRFWGVYSPITIINYCLPVFLLILGDANQYQRIFASKNAKGARTAVLIMIFLSLAIELLIISSAWISSSLIPDPENGRYVLIYAAKHFMPLPLGILFLVTVVGIIISTADSFLLVPATTFIKDVYLVHINPKASEKHVVLLSRLLVLAFGIIAYLVSLAFAESTTVFRKALYAFTIYGAAITPCLVAAMFWNRSTKYGAVASILVGTVTALAWEELRFIKAALPAWAADLDAVLPAITLSVVALVGVSLLTGRTNPTGTE